MESLPLIPSFCLQPVALIRLISAAECFPYTEEHLLLLLTIWENEDAIVCLAILCPHLFSIFLAFYLLLFLFPSTKALFGLLTARLRPNEIS